MAQVPAERSLVKKFENRHFALIGVNSDGDEVDVEARNEEAGITWRSFRDGGPDGPIAKQWGVSAWPTTYLVDHEGVIHARDLEGEDLVDEIEKLLKRAERAGESD